MTTTTTNPTTEAIQTAIRNADKMIGYTVKASQSVPGYFFCIKPGTNGRVFYTVNTNPGAEKCDCPQWEREGVCKHQKFVDDTNRIDREAEEREDWPLCPTHGAFLAATNGSPMSTCDRCEDYRF